MSTTRHTLRRTVLVSAALACALALCHGPGRAVTGAGPAADGPRPSRDPESSVKTPSDDAALPAPDGLLLPDEEARLAEQIETVRAGMPSAVPRDPAAAAGSSLPLEALGLLAAGAALIGCGIGLVLASWTRRRASARAPAPAARVPSPVPEAARARKPRLPALRLPRATASPKGLTSLWTGRSPDAASSATAAPGSSAPRPAPGRDPMEGRLDLLESSMLQLLQTVERLAARGPDPVLPPLPSRSAPEEDEPAVPAGLTRVVHALTYGRPAPDPAPARNPSKMPSEFIARSPDPASTVDGRNLGRIRRAVLRLAEAGWDGERIARRLRLGTGDVQLILKSAGRVREDSAAQKMFSA